MKTILINARECSISGGEIRIAALDGSQLDAFHIETEWKENIKGNIYRAYVSNVEPSLQAAFVDYGATRHGFLALSDVAAHAVRDDGPPHPRHINEALKRRQPITVQVLKEEVGNKGAALTTYISLPGRYVVLIVGGDGHGISRKIESDEERQRIRALTRELNLPPGFGFIVRTAGMDQPKTALARDVKYLLKLWQTIEKKIAQAQPPALVHQEQGLITRTLRDYLTTDIGRIVVDTQEALQEVQDFLQLVWPRGIKNLELYQKPRPLFAEFNIETQIDSLYQRRVSLPSGGSLVIDQTEALVAIDVNSGKSTKEQRQSETAYRTNLEAVNEAARQLRLRDLGGIIVLDLIDMADAKHNSEVEQHFKLAIKRDKARFEVGRISSHGLLIMTRQRIRPALSLAMTPCPHCDRTGLMRPIQSEVSRLFRLLADKLATSVTASQKAKVSVRAKAEVALSILNERRNEMLALEKQFRAAIFVEPFAHDQGGEPQIQIEANDAPLRENESVTKKTVSPAPQHEANLTASGDQALNAPISGAPKRRRRPRRRRKPLTATDVAPVVASVVPENDGIKS